MRYTCGILRGSRYFKLILVSFLVRPAKELFSLARSLRRWSVALPWQRGGWPPQ